MLMDFDSLEDQEHGGAVAPPLLPALLEGGKAAASLAGSPGGSPTATCPDAQQALLPEARSDASANVTETTDAGTCLDPDSDDGLDKEQVELHDGYGQADAAPNIYTQEREPETEEERRIRQEIELHRSLIDLESEIEAQWREEEERAQAERDGLPGTVMVVSITGAKGAKVEKNFVDAMNEILISCHEALSGLFELDSWWEGFSHRLFVVAHFMTGFVHHHFRPQAAHNFQRIVDELAKPATGILGITSRWKAIDKRRQARCLPEYAGKAERALAGLVTQLQRAAGHLVSSNPRTARKVSRAIARLQELRQAGAERLALVEAKQLPAVDGSRALRVVLRAHRAAGEQVVQVSSETTVGGLRDLLVGHGGLPAATRLLHRPPEFLGTRMVLGMQFLELPPEVCLRDLESGAPQVHVSVPPDVSDDSDEEEGAGPPKWLPSWPFPMGGKYPILKVTSASGTRLLAELRAAYADRAFQREYKELRHGGQGGMEHVLKALSVQCKILPRYGFAGTNDGVIEMRHHTSWWSKIHPPMAKLLRDIHSLLEYGKPLPKLPTVRPFAPPRFARTDTAAWKRHLADEGFVVISGVVQQEELQQAHDHLWEFLEGSDMCGLLRRSNPSTWDHVDHKFAGWPAGKQDGIIHTRGMGQSRLLWYLRTLPALKQVFADLWGTQELVTSLDGAGVFRPYGHRPDWKTTKTNWFHVDQGHKKRGLHCVQGLVPLLDANERTGSLVVVPRSHRFHNEILSRYPINGNGWNFIPLKPDDRILTEGDLGPRLIVARAGDLVLWDSRTVHCNSPPLKESQLLRRRELLRAVAYICMTPAAWCSPRVLQEREEMVRGGVTTSHWPHEVHPMTRYGGELTQEERRMKSLMQTGDLDEPEARAWLRKIGEHKKRIQDQAAECMASEVAAGLIRPAAELQDRPSPPGCASIFAGEEFRVESHEGVPLRRSPTVEWDEPIGKLDHGKHIHGYRFGPWVCLSSLPEGMDAKSLGREEGDIWACVDGERGMDGALRPVP